MSHRAVYKTATAEYLDYAYDGVSRPLEEAFDDASTLLESDGALSDTTRELESRGVFPDSADGFDARWLDPSAKHGDKSADRVLRCGYREAVERARACHVPLETFWVTGAGNDFELHICESSNRITVFMFVPSEDSRRYGSRRAQTRSWVVRVGNLADVHPDAPREILDRGDPPVYRIQVSGPVEGSSAS